MGRRASNRVANQVADVELPSVDIDAEVPEIGGDTEVDVIPLNGHAENSIENLIEAETVIGAGSQVIEVPLGRLFPGYMPRRVDVQKMTAVQKENLKRITIGLVASDAQLENGKKVKNGQDAIKWILEQIAPA